MRFINILNVTADFRVSTCHVTNILFMLLKCYWERMFDRNTLYSLIVYCIHGYYYRLLFLLLFTMYTIIVDCYTVPLLSPHRPSIISNMNIDCIN